MSRSVLLASNYNVWREPFNSQSQSFLSVVAGLEHADLLVPEGAPYLLGHGVRPSVNYLIAEIKHRLLSQARNRIGLSSLSNMKPTEVTGNHDLFFFCCQFPHELSALDRLAGWREKTGIAVAYILETWSSTLSRSASNLRMLDQFDHVFVLNEQCVPQLCKYTRAPISGLSPATDCLLATPLPSPPRRAIDVYSFGRRSPEVHAELLEISKEAADFFYVYDSVQGCQVRNWLEHRLLLASQMKRAKFFIAFNPGDVGAGPPGPFQNEQAVSTRYFEGVAGGAIVLGTHPDTAEFAKHFDWPGAVIPLSPKGGVRELIMELLSQHDRLAELSHRNVVESLRRHDWSYRWQKILEVIGMDQAPGMAERHERLWGLSELPYS